MRHTVGSGLLGTGLLCSGLLCDVASVGVWLAPELWMRRSVDKQAQTECLYEPAVS